MTYKITISSAAAKAFRHLPQVDAKRISRKIDLLAENPRPMGVEKLSGTDDRFRIRSSDYRVIYQTEDQKLHVPVIKIGHRHEIYQR